MKRSCIPHLALIQRNEIDVRQSGWYSIAVGSAMPFNNVRTCVIKLSGLYDNHYVYITCVINNRFIRIGRE